MGLPTAERNTIRDGEQGVYREQVYPAAADTFYVGWPIGVGTDDNYCKNLSGTLVRPVGICLETKTVTTAGSDTIRVGQGDYWLKNSTTNTISGSRVGEIASAEITTTNDVVGCSKPGFQFMGKINKVSADGAYVSVRIDPATTPASGSTIIAIV